jgi:hypothetical protein
MGARRKPPGRLTVAPPVHAGGLITSHSKPTPSDRYFANHVSAASAASNNRFAAHYEFNTRNHPQPSVLEVALIRSAGPATIGSRVRLALPHRLIQFEVPSGPRPSRVSRRAPPYAAGGAHVRSHRLWRARWGGDHPPDPPALDKDHSH